jgi:HSP20 family molecular chaperone IbpA
MKAPVVRSCVMARIEKAIEVNVPLRMAYNQWTQFEDFPRFMEGVREVRQLDDAHLHWRVERHGKELEWDTEITDQVPDQSIAWRDLSGPKHTGSVTCQSVHPDRTRVQITMDIDLSGATAEEIQAEQALELRLEHDLARFKQMMETRSQASGAWRGEIHQGQPVQSAGASRPDEARGNPPGEAGAAEGRDKSDASGKAGGPQSWIPNLLRGWEEPLVRMRRITEEMDQMFEKYIGRPVGARSGQGGMAGKWMPPVEVSQRDNRLVVSADLPGIRREDVQIEIKGGKLTIEGERREAGEQTVPEGYRRSERTYGQFYRMIPLPEGVDPDSATAAMQDGVLEITVLMPTAEERRGRRIDIQVPK